MPKEGLKQRKERFQGNRECQSRDVGTSRDQGREINRIRKGATEKTREEKRSNSESERGIYRPIRSLKELEVGRLKLHCIRAIKLEAGRKAKEEMLSVGQ